MAIQEDFKVGSMVWVPCEVRGGPFPDERMVYIESKVGEWFGFVNVSELEDRVPRGKDRVRGAILAIKPGSVIVLGIQGQSPASKPLQAEQSFIQHGAVQTPAH